MSIISDLFLPKFGIIDRPGMIISRTSRRFGGQESQKRQIFYFEDTLANLQLETIKEIGKEKTAELWYRIGRDMGARYSLLSKARVVPKFLRPMVINFLVNMCSAAGLSIKSIEYDNKNSSLILKSSDTLICRKSGIETFIPGVISSAMSILFGEKIEAKTECNNCNENCKIIASPEIKEKYTPNIEKLKPLENYNELNFPKEIRAQGKLYSFSDLINFKIARIDSSGRFYLNNSALIPVEVGLSGIISEHYLNINYKHLLERGLIGGAEKTAKDILKSKATEDKLEELKGILCAFGWGIPYYKLSDEKITFNFVHPPITRFGFLYQALELNGFLNYIFGKKLKIKNFNSELNPVKAVFEFEHQ